MHLYMEDDNDSGNKGMSDGEGEGYDFVEGFISTMNETIHERIECL